MSSPDIPDGVPPGLVPGEIPHAKEREFQVVSRKFSIQGLAEQSQAPPIILKAVAGLLGDDFTRERSFIAVHEVKRRDDGTIHAFNNQSVLDAKSLDDLIDLLIRMKDHALKHGMKTLGQVDCEMGKCDCGEDHGPRWKEQYMHRRDDVEGPETPDTPKNEDENEEDE